MSKQISEEISGKTIRETVGGISRKVYWGFFYKQKTKVPQ